MRSLIIEPVTNIVLFIIIIPREKLGNVKTIFCSIIKSKAMQELFFKRKQLILSLCTVILFSASPFFSISQETDSKPIKKYEFELVEVMSKTMSDIAFHTTGRFTGIGEIIIYDDSIIIYWSNEWECGQYRMYVDTVTYSEYDMELQYESVQLYTVRSMGYHDVNGGFSLIEGVDEEIGPYVIAILDTQFNKEGFSEKRRIYVDLKEQNLSEEE